MSVLPQLIRIDDRLIHGQVVIGWVSSLKTDFILLADDEVAANEWEAELYISSVPSELEALVLPFKDAVSYIQHYPERMGRSILLINSVNSIKALLDLGLQFNDVNIGGIHFREGRKQYLPYVFLSDVEMLGLQECAGRGVHFYCQDIPAGKKHKLSELLHT